MKNEMILIPRKSLELLNTEGFILAVEEKLSRTSTVKEAYELTEQEMENYFEKRKFSDFKTFATIRYRRNKLKRKK